MHHSDPEMDVTTGVRFHTGEAVLSATGRLAVLPLLGVSLSQVAVYEAVFLPVVLFHHSNVRLPRWLDHGLLALIVTPIPSDQTVRNALAATLPEIAELERRLNLALVTRLPKALRRKSRMVAIDLTLIAISSCESRRFAARPGCAAFCAPGVLLSARPLLLTPAGQVQVKSAPRLRPRRSTHGWRTGWPSVRRTGRVAFVAHPSPLPIGENSLDFRQNFLLLLRREQREWPHALRL
jgi:hypothetical protein